MVAAAATQGFQKIRKAYEDMLYALVDSKETTLDNENKSSPTSMDSGDRKSNVNECLSKMKNFTLKQPIPTDADDECDSQDHESSAQHEKESCHNPTPESVQSFL